MIRVRQVCVGIDKNTDEEIHKKISSKLHVPLKDIIHFTVHKMSIDARKRKDLQYSYELDVMVKKEENILRKNKSNDLLRTPKEVYIFPPLGTKKMKHRPVIVGSGPAGLLAAYLLSEKGYAPIIIERGEKVEDRIDTVQEFWNTGKLNTESNIQFGEGGAGTFSDGKLNTLVKDKFFRSKKVFNVLVESGAPKEILYLSKPHIGTDLLREVVKNMRNKILEMGGEFQYNTCLTNLLISENQIEAIEVNHHQKIDCDVLVLATGHSARDTFKMLYENHLHMEAKPFAVGIRIQHPQKMINDSQYGPETYPILPAASYKLTYTTSEKRGVYSFCMCPGGYVVNSSSEKNRLAINGMSDHARDSENANSAVVVTVTPKDFGPHPLDGIEYQRKLEEKAYQIGKGKIPIQLWKDFKTNSPSTQFGAVAPIFKGSYCFADLNEIFPHYICDSLKEAVPIFNEKIIGYAREDAILAGIESRTSSPLRIERNEFCVSNIRGIYPCGEGAGYAGGITTSAMDGIKVAEAIASVFDIS